MKRLALFSLVSIFLMAFASTAIAKVSSFDLLVDNSGSMLMTSTEVAQPKFDAAKIILERVNARIPAQNYTAGIHTFAPKGEVVAPQAYNKAAFADSIVKMKGQKEVFGNLTPMGAGLSTLGANVYAGMSQPTAVIIVADGENNLGIDLVDGANAALASNPGICFHIISLANTAEGQANLDRLAALKPCTVSVKGADLLTNDAAVDKFVQDVFGGGSGLLVLRSLQFPFDSAVITEDSAVVLDEVVKMAKANGKNIQIDGHTCSIGDAAYNQGLSERRAAAVKTYMASKGIPANSIKTAGFGEDKPKFDNNTNEGRVLNRRAEIDFR